MAGSPVTTAPPITNVEIDSLWALLEAGRPADVVETLHYRRNDLPEPALVLLGLAHFDAGDPAAARETLESVLATNPENTVARLFRILTLYQCGDRAEAARELGGDAPLLPHRGFLERFLVLFWPLRGEILAFEGPPPAEDDGNPAGHPALAKDHEWWKANRDSIDTARMEGYPGGRAISQVSFLLAECLSAEGRRQARARKVGERHARQGVKSFLAGRPAEALALLERAHAIAPRNETWASNLAFAALHCGRPGRARDVLEPFLERATSPGRDAATTPLPLPDTVVCEAWALHDLGRHGEALRLLALVEPDGPEDCYTHFLAAMCHLEMGNRGEFRRLFRISQDAYFIDTWEQILRPFIVRTGRWMQAP